MFASRSATDVGVVARLLGAADTADLRSERTAAVLGLLPQASHSAPPHCPHYRTRPGQSQATWSWLGASSLCELPVLSCCCQPGTGLSLSLSLSTGMRCPLRRPREPCSRAAHTGLLAYMTTAIFVASLRGESGVASGVELRFSCRWLALERILKGTLGVAVVVCPRLPDASEDARRADLYCASSCTSHLAPHTLYLAPHALLHALLTCTAGGALPC